MNSSRRQQKLSTAVSIDLAVFFVYTCNTIVSLRTTLNSVTNPCLGGGFCVV